MKAKNIKPSPEFKEKCFWTWYNNSRNIAAALRELKQEGYVITSKSLYAWKKELEWEDRAARIDTDKAQAADKCASIDAVFLEKIQDRIAMYDNYLETLPAGKMDNNAIFAYLQLMELAIKLSKNIKPDTDRPAGIDMNKAAELRKLLLGS